MGGFHSRVKLSEFDSSVGLDRGAGKFKEVLWYFFKVVFFMSALPYPQSLKILLLKLFGATVGTGIVIKPKVNIHFPWKLRLGNDVWIGEDVFILNFEMVDIGNNVCISQRSFLCGGNHNYMVPNMPYRNGSITLKDGVWIGANCFVGPNVNIGIDTVIVACSVVTQDVSDNLVTKIDIPSFEKNRWKE